MKKNTTTVLSTPHFVLEEITGGVYAAIVKEGSGALGNAGIVNLGDCTLIFDTFLIPDAAKELRKAAEKLTGNKVKYVVNSHFHGDHTNGNQVFEDCVIISTVQTRELMEQHAVNDKESKETIISEYETYLKNQEERIKNETDENKLRGLINDLKDKRIFTTAILSIQPTLPTFTFSDLLKIHGTQRSVQVITYGGGHTSSDAFLFLPDDKIAFMADLVAVKVHPWLGSGNPEECLSILKKVKALDIHQIVPGHGQVGTIKSIDEVSDYIVDVLRLIPNLEKKGISVEDAEIPSKYLDWNDAHIFEWNLRHFLKLN